MITKYVTQFIGPNGESVEREYTTEAGARRRVADCPEGWHAQIAEHHTKREDRDETRDHSGS